MITKTFTGANNKQFVAYANALIKKEGFDKSIANMILNAYENGVDPMQLKEYLRASMDFVVLNMMLKTDMEFNKMIERRINDKFNLCDDEVLACAAHEAWKSVTK